MKKVIFFILLSLTFSFCSPSRQTTVKVPKPTNQKWFTKKSLRKYSEEFSNKDWSTFKQKDSSINHFLDSLTKSVLENN